MTLRQRTLRAGAWTIVSYSVELSSRLLTNLILTRLLFPDAFGIAAAATSLLVGLNLLSDFGVKTVIIQSPRGEDTDFLRSAWVFQSSRGVLLWLVLVAVSGLLRTSIVHSFLPASSVFSNSIFPAVISVLGLTLVLNGVESTAIPLNIRRLHFRPIVILDLISRLLPIPVMIAWAYAFPSVWAMVAGALVGSLLRLLLSHLIVPGPRMLLTWHKEHIKEVVTFGRWINLSSFSTFFGSQSDVIILGLLLPGPMLGIYYLAKSLRDAIETFLERLNDAMALPVLGEVIRNNPHHLRDRYYKFRLPIDLVASASAGFLFAAGDVMVNILYDPRYSEAGLMLRILSFGLLLYPLQVIRSAFTAIARANVVAWVSMLQAATLILCLSLGYYLWGPLGAIAGVAGNRIFPSIAWLILASRASWISPLKELRLALTYLAGFVLGILFNYLFGSLTHVGLRHFFA